MALSGHERGGLAGRGDPLAGAAACLEKPIASLGAFQECVLSVLPDADTRRGPTSASWRSTGGASVGAALEEDLRRARALLAEALPAGDRETVAYCAQFLGRSARCSATPTSAARTAAEPGEGSGACRSPRRPRSEARAATWPAAPRVSCRESRSSPRYAFLLPPILPP